MQGGSEQLHSVDEAWAGSREIGTGVRSEELLNACQLGTVHQGLAFPNGSLEVVATGHEHHHVGCRRLDGLPGQAHRGRAV